jgi:hypothetical protein
VTTFHFQPSSPGQPHWRIRWDRIGTIIAINAFWALILLGLVLRKLL